MLEAVRQRDGDGKRDVDQPWYSFIAMPSPAVVIGLVAVALLGATLLWWIITGTRSREQLQALMARVEELEQRLSDGATGVAGVEPEPLPAAQETPDRLAVTSDALAGWTSHVGRILTMECTPSSLAEQAVVAAYRHIEDPVRPSDLADELVVSLRSLQRGLLSSLGCSPSDLILTVKMREARRMLESGHFRVGEVAHRLGFADAAHFSRRYQQYYRCPPSRHTANVAISS